MREKMKEEKLVCTDQPAETLYEVIDTEVKSSTAETKTRKIIFIIS